MKKIIFILLLIPLIMVGQNFNFKKFDTTNIYDKIRFDSTILANRIYQDSLLLSDKVDSVWVDLDSLRVIDNGIYSVYPLATVPTILRDTMYRNIDSIIHINNGLKSFIIDDDTCVISGTRSQLLALRTANALKSSCAYILTDHVQGRLVAGTTIQLHAVATNEFSENVSVNTTYDNDAWKGIYDIDRALVLELQDNRNNICRGFNGTEVTNFDWGNTNYTNCLVDNATWTTTIGQIRSCTNVKVTEGSSLTNTTQTGGTLTNITLKGQSTMVLTNANVSLRSFDLDKASFFQSTAYTGGNLISNHNLFGSTLNLSNSTSQYTLNGVDMVNSTINHTSVTTGTLTGTNLYIYGGSTINHQTGAGNLSLNRVTIDGASSINHSIGTISISSYRILGGSQVIAQTTAGSINLNNGYLDAQSTINNQSACAINGTRLEVDRASNISCQSGSTGTQTLTSTKFDNGSAFTLTTTSTSGNTSITNSTFNSGSFFQKSGTGVNTITQSDFFGQSRVVSTSANGLNITRTTLSELVQVNVNNANISTSGMSDCSFNARSTISFSANGGNNMFYTNGTGISTNVNFSGTSVSQTLQQADINNSSVTFNNNTAANTFSQITLENSTFVAQGLTLNKGTTYINATNGSTININAPTGVGTISYLTADNVSTIIIQGTAGTSTRLTALQQGGINHNGGSATNITKMMPNTLITGAFNHSNLIMISPTNRTLTGANTNRSEYLGVVSSTPLF